MELVAVGLDLLEEALDACETVAAFVDPLPVFLVELGVGTCHVHAPLLRRLDELFLVPASRRMGPRLHRALAQAAGRVGDDQRLVVAKNITEALALGAGAEG